MRPKIVRRVKPTRELPNSRFFRIFTLLIQIDQLEDSPLQPMTDFNEYIRQSEPCRQERAYTWQTAIGLQAVDGLKPSDYLKDTARRHIEGKITIDEAQNAIKNYYQSKDHRAPKDSETYEADQASAHIVQILSTRTLDFSPKGYIALHRRIFDGIFKCAGKIRDYDISKKEWVLDGDSVSYLNWEDLRRALDYDIEQERQFSYAGLSPDALTSHITTFVSSLWQIHPFAEGNTRTTAVFIIQYLRSLGFDDVSNTLFANHAWYFRNALVRANYKNAPKGIDYTPIYLERFFRNLLLKEQWDLRNRYLHIHPTEAWREQPCQSTMNESPPLYRTSSTSGGVQPAEYTQVQDKYRISTGQVQVAKPTQTQDKHRTSTSSETNPNAGQVQDKHRISTGQVQETQIELNYNITRLLSSIQKDQISVKDLMDRLHLKGRDNFLKLYLNPALQVGLVCRLFPDSPRHPKQKYRLTAKGLALWRTLHRQDGQARQNVQTHQPA